MFSAAYSRSQLASALDRPEASIVWEVADPAQYRYVRSNQSRTCDAELVGFTSDAQGNRVREFWLSPDSDPYPGVGTPTEACDPRTLAPNEPGRQTLRSWYGPEGCRAAGVADDSLPAEDAPRELVRLASEVESQRRKPQRGMMHVPSYQSAGSLLASNPELRPAVIDGICRTGETINIIAAPKAGKSWLATDLALSVVTGSRWFDHFECQRGGALIIDAELHPETSAYRLRKVTEARGLHRRDWINDLQIDNVRGRLLSIDRMGDYFDAIDPGEFKLIVLDAWYRFLPAGQSENDNALIRDAYNILDSYSRDLDCSFALIHHSSKGNQGEKSVTDVGAGAGAQSRAADAHLVMRPHEDEDCAVLDGVVRSFPPIDPFVLRWQFPVWTPDYKLSPERLQMPKGRSEQKQERRDEDGLSEIVAVLNDESQPVTRYRLRQATGFGAARVNRLIAAGISTGQITIAGETDTKHGDVTDLIRLAI